MCKMSPTTDSNRPTTVLVSFNWTDRFARSLQNICIICLLASRQTTSNSHVSCNSRMQCSAAAQHLHMHNSRLQAGRMMTLDCWGEQCLYNRTQTCIATTAYVTALCISCQNITEDRTQEGTHTPFGQQQLYCIAL